MGSSKLRLDCYFQHLAERGAEEEGGQREIHNSKLRVDCYFQHLAKRGAEAVSEELRMSCSTHHYSVQWWCMRGCFWISLLGKLLPQMHAYCDDGITSLRFRACRTELDMPRQSMSHR